MIQDEGPGWRLAKDSSRRNFEFLLGGDHWAIEITKAEWNSVNLLIQDLINQYQRLESQLMPEEDLFIELERGHWWACIDGAIGQWSLRLILKENEPSIRGFEAFWPAPASQSIVFAMRTMWDCYQ